MTIDSTIAGQSSNSYVDVSYADSYFSDHYDATKSTAWAALTTGKKTTALIQAARILETVKVVNTDISDLEYIPAFNRLTGTVTFFFEDSDNVVKSSYNQKLQFPRNLDISQTTGLYFIPEEIKMAQCEQAVFLLDFDQDSLTAKLSGVSNDVVTAGQISIRKEISQKGSMLAPMALEFLKPYIISSNHLRRM